MGARRGGRDDSPLAGLLRRGPVREATPEREERGEGNGRAAPEAGDERRTARSDPRTEARQATSPAGPAKKRRGRPRGGRRSNPDYVQISARIHKDVRFSLERVLAERSQREGRYVEMAEVLEDLMRFYVENGDPYEMLGEER